MMQIDLFRGKHGFLSNFSQCPVTYEGLTYPTAEAAFQAQKCQSEEGKLKYTLTKNPVRAKQMGRREPGLPGNWSEISPGIMLGILRAKFSTPDMAQKLLDTEDAELVEGNQHHDNFWGDCRCQRCAERPGKNLLGKLLMQVRSELRER